MGKYKMLSVSLLDCTDADFMVEWFCIPSIAVSSLPPVFVLNFFSVII